MMRMVRVTTVLLLFIAAAAHAATRHRAIGAFPLPSCVPGTVVHTDGFVTDFALAGGFIFWGDEEGNVWRAPANGLTATLLAQANAPVTWIAADGARVYFMTTADGLPNSDIFSVSKDGGAPTTVAGSILTPSRLDTDAQFIYWADAGTRSTSGINSDGAIRRVSKAGGQVQTLASGLSFPAAIAVFGGNIFFGEAGVALGNPSAGVRRMPAAGGDVTHLSDGQAIFALAVDGTGVYAIVVHVDDGTADIDRLPIAGGALVSLQTGLTFADDPVIHGGKLFFGSVRGDDVTIQEIDTATGTSKALGDFIPQLARVGFDDCLVYYVNGDDAFARVAP